MTDNGDDTYNTTGCKTWCRTGTIRVEGAYGIPGVVLSSPHFLYGDEDIYLVRFGFILRRTILKFPKTFVSQSGPAGPWDGIAPDPGLHRTVLRMEKKTGLAVEANKRIQGHFTILAHVTLICTGLGKKMVPRLRESHLLTTSGHGSRVHAT